MQAQSLPLFPVKQTRAGVQIGAMAVAAAAGAKAPRLELADLPSPPASAPRPR